MKLTDWNLNKTDCKYLIVLLIFSLISIFYRTQFHMSGGVFSPDKAVYLINALKYSGMDYYNIANMEDIFFSPIISFLTSILFRLGIVDQLAISIVSSIYALLGYFGLYFLLKERFNSLLSLTGVIIYGSISEFLINLSSGLLDVPAISISIWILLLAIIAIDKNSKYFILILPLLVIGFFTRYTVGFMLPLIVMYYIMKKNIYNCLISYNKKQIKDKIIKYLNSAEFKIILASILLGAITFILISKYLILDFGGSLSFIEQSQNTFNGFKSTGGTDFNPDKLFYIKNFSEFLFNEERTLDTTLSYLLYGLITIGLSIKIIYSVKKLNFDILKETISNKYNLLLFLIIFLFIISAITGFKLFSNHMITNISSIIVLISFYYLINRITNENDKHSLTILNIGYFIIYFVFMATYSIKVLRYALPILPPFIYFAIFGLESILNELNNIKINLKHTTPNIAKKQKYINLIPIFIIILFMISTFTFIEPMQIEGYPNSLVDASNYIISHDSDYHEKTFATNNHNYRLLKWNINENVTYIIKENENPDLCNATYIINWEKYDLKNYKEIYNNSYYHVYYHN